MFNLMELSHTRYTSYFLTSSEQINKLEISWRGNVITG